MHTGGIARFLRSPLVWEHGFHRSLQGSLTPAYRVRSDTGIRTFRAQIRQGDKLKDTWVASVTGTAR